MDDKKIEEAVNYAASTNKIEDLNLTKVELKEVKNAILEKKDTDSFIEGITKKRDKSDKNK